LRHPLLKKALPDRAILVAEKLAQARLAKIQFGPSLFFLLRNEPPGASTEAEEQAR
jgi:hypothetical protein